MSVVRQPTQPAECPSLLVPLSPGLQAPKVGQTLSFQDTGTLFILAAALASDTDIQPRNTAPAVEFGWNNHGFPATSTSN